MSYEEGYYGGYGYDRGRGGDEGSIPSFLSRLSPGIEVELQYDDRPPARGTFQGFEQGNAMLTDYNGFPGLVRISPRRINAVSPFGYGGHGKNDYDC